MPILRPHPLQFHYDVIFSFTNSFQIIKFVPLGLFSFYEFQANLWQMCSKIMQYVFGIHYDFIAIKITCDHDKPRRTSI